MGAIKSNILGNSSNNVKKIKENDGTEEVEKKRETKWKQ